MEDPTTAPWGLPISDEDFAKLQRGLRCRSSDDKWVIRAMTDEELLERELELLPDTCEKPELEKRQSPSPRVPTEEEMLEEESLEDEPEYEEGPVDLTKSAKISIIRAWTNQELYRLLIKPANSEAGTSAEIEAIIWSMNFLGERLTEEQAKIDVVIMCRHMVDCDFAAAPEYGTELYSVWLK